MTTLRETGHWWDHRLELHSVFMCLQLKGDGEKGADKGERERERKESEERKYLVGYMLL